MKSQTDIKRLAVCTSLVKAARRWRIVSKRSLAFVPLPEACAAPLLVAKRLGEPVHQATLAQMSGLKDSELVRLLNQMEQEGLMQRVPDSDDRRANTVCLTDKGHSTASDAEVRFGELRERALAKFSDDELDTTLRVLQAFVSA